MATPDPRVFLAEMLTLIEQVNSGNVKPILERAQKLCDQFQAPEVQDRVVPRAIELSVIAIAANRAVRSEMPELFMTLLNTTYLLGYSDGKHDQALSQVKELVDAE